MKLIIIVLAIIGWAVIVGVLRASLDEGFHTSGIRSDRDEEGQTDE